jgi:acyl carrier protein
MCPVVNNTEIRLDDFYYGKNMRHLLKRLNDRDDELGTSSIALKLLANNLIQGVTEPEDIGECVREFICNLAQKLASRGGDTQKCCLALVATAKCLVSEHANGLITYEGVEGNGISKKTFYRHLKKAYILIVKELKRIVNEPNEPEIVSETSGNYEMIVNAKNYKNELLETSTSELSRYKLEHITKFWPQSADISSVDDAVLKVVGDHLGIPGVTLSLSSHIMYDLGADPFDKLELIMTIEELFNIRIRGEDANRVERVSDIVTTIKKTLEDSVERNKAKKV